MMWIYNCYQVAEPLRAMVMGAPLEDARHLAQRYDRMRQEAEAQVSLIFDYQLPSDCLGPFYSCKNIWLDCITVMFCVQLMILILISIQLKTLNPNNFLLQAHHCVFF